MATKTKTSTPKSSTINGVHAVVQPRGPPVPASALQNQPRGTPKTSLKSAKSLTIVSWNRSRQTSGGTWPRSGEKSQQLLNIFTWVVSISRGVPPSLIHSSSVLRRMAVPPKNKTQRKKLRVENVKENSESSTPLKRTRRRTSQRASYPSLPIPLGLPESGA